MYKRPFSVSISSRQSKTYRDHSWHSQNQKLDPRNSDDTGFTKNDPPTQKSCKRPFLCIDQRSDTNRTAYLPKLLQTIHADTRLTRHEISRFTTQFCNTMHRKQMWLQNRERFAGTLKYQYYAQFICASKSGTEKKMHGANVKTTTLTISIFWINSWIWMTNRDN